MPRRSLRDSIGTRPRNYALPTSFLPSVIEANKAAMDEAIIAHYFSLPQPADMFYIAETTLRICSCKSRTAPAQLLRVGLFPCSPCNPTLAVDIQLLDFVRHLYLRIAPNNTAFCRALESTLGDRGLKFFEGEQLRIRFNNAFQWYLDLVTLTNKHIDDVLDPVREQTRDEYDADHPSAPVDVPPAPDVPSAPVDVPSAPDVPPAPSPPTPRHNSRRATVEEVDDEDDTTTSTAAPSPQIPRTPGRKRSREAATGSDEDDDEADKRHRTGAPNPFGPPPPRTRPSAYLIKKCPACFAGLRHDPSQRYDLAVCEDGNFAQKRCPGQGGIDPRREHPDTCFVDSFSKPMEAYVDGIRKSAPSRREPDAEEEDGYEGRLKASTQFFAQTGLMGLVCRHDVVLFLVNLESAGEKQFYSLLLLEALFQHLPPDIRVAVLYDIACQLDRSCEKWGFLDRYRDRIAFAVSVFHAFGHIWACQLVYHPHKCIGFGFENGECAERVWFAIQHLIANLRVSGYHQRIFIIDLQLEHHAETALRGMGSWLVRRTLQCQNRVTEALAILRSSRWSEDELQAEYARQVAFQTRPLPRRRRRLFPRPSRPSLRRRRTSKLTRELHQLKVALPRLSVPEMPQQYDRIDEVDEALQKSRRQLLSTKNQLGTDDRRALEKMAHKAYYTARLNAGALKTRLQSKIAARKQELDPVERSLRRSTASNERKKHSQATSAVQRRDPGIKKLVKLFNKEVTTIKKLIRERKAPTGAIVPEPLNESSVFKLDIDDAIWSEVGLVDMPADIPEALLNADLRRCINALLVKQRGEEETHRLKREHGHLRIWFSTEWTATLRALAQCTDGT
ncbi:CxC2 domain-containing protein [Mycena chlorophos]|uniref:CxC2 domain-containing protein n=1 Tax=Mycena chlorophos TaxID=658473 RepID=A0A8H6W8S2_MYCCL|nr:CxC2 domain-containing protein [Mycena chlorophos]